MRQIREELSDGSSGLCVVDIDDTLIRADLRDTGIWKISNGKKTRLSTEDFANDPDRGKPGVRYDYKEFKDPEKVRRSILRGTPLIQNIKYIQEKVSEGYDLCFLTARSAESVVKSVIKEFFSEKFPDLAEAFKEGLSHAVSDEKYLEVIDGMTDAQKKCYFLEKVCDLYDSVIFFDDDRKNVMAAHALGLDNLRVVQVTR